MHDYWKHQSFDYHICLYSPIHCPPISNFPILLLWNTWSFSNKISSISSPLMEMSPLYSCSNWNPVLWEQCFLAASQVIDAVLPHLSEHERDGISVLLTFQCQTQIILHPSSLKTIEFMSSVNNNDYPFPISKTLGHPLFWFEDFISEYGCTLSIHRHHNSYWIYCLCRWVPNMLAFQFLLFFFFHLFLLVGG